MVQEQESVVETWTRFSSNSSICIGNEIPEWFQYQSEGYSIDIKPPPDWYSNNFLGFAVCMVAQFWGYDSDQFLEFKCDFHFKSNDGGSQKFTAFQESWVRHSAVLYSKPHHVYILYQPVGYFHTVVNEGPFVFTMPRRLHLNSALRVMMECVSPVTKGKDVVSHCCMHKMQRSFVP